jgi:hypothetical protein
MCVYENRNLGCKYKISQISYRVLTHNSCFICRALTQRTPKISDQKRRKKPCPKFSTISKSEIGENLNKHPQLGFSYTHVKFS